MAQPKYSIVIIPTTAAVTAADPTNKSITIETGSSLTVSVFGLQSSETATVQALNPIDNTYHNYYPTPGGALVQFNATLNVQDVWFSAGVYKMTKTITTVAVGVAVQFQL